jgi:hypothetical protein
MSVFSRALALLALGSASACGGTDMPPAKMVPTPDQVRTTYGLTDQSCWVYCYTDVASNAKLTNTISVAGPDMNAIAGKTVYVEKNQLAAGGLPTEDYFDTESNAEILLLRHIEGAADMRIDKRYDMDPTPPIFAKFSFDKKKNVVLNVGDVYDVMTTPMGMPAEHHVWSVLGFSDVVKTSTGSATAYKMRYSVGSSSRLFWIVPTFGVAKYEDENQQTHQVVASGNGQGACNTVPTCP